MRTSKLSRIENSRRSYLSRISGRRFSDLLLLASTTVELTLLMLLTPNFTVTDWIYVTQHLMVLVIAATRAPAKQVDRSLPTALAVVASYAYPYAQVIYLGWIPGDAVWPSGGLVLVIFSACLSLASLFSLGRLFGIRPALRDLATRGPYRLVRHPMYLSYILGDIGYNLQEWNFGTALMVIAGWVSLFWRIQAEERILAGSPG